MSGFAPLKDSEVHLVIDDDPIVEEVRKHREEHASAYGHDLRLIVAALQMREARSKRPVLNPGPKYLLRKTSG
ncbi:hypothetical protein CKO22_18525 [Thiococcus pfennigii]|nr:hypothetical protein [Thiococcus pfennigii]